MSQLLGLADEWIAYAVDQAAVLVTEHYESEKRAAMASMLAQGAAAKVLREFADGSDSSDSEDSDYAPPVFVGGPSYHDGGQPVYVDGEYRGGGERIKMSQDEFIKRTTVPDKYAASRVKVKLGDPGAVWWETKGTPRIIDFNDEDVL